MNNKWLVIGLVGVIVVLLGVIAYGVLAFNQQPFAYGPGGMNPAMYAMMNSHGAGMMGGRGMSGMMYGSGRGGFGAQNSLIAVAAKDLNLNATDLLTQLQGGKSIADVAKEKNISTDKIVDNFLGAHSAQMKTAVDSKWLTQAQADSMLALMKAHAQAQINAKGTAQTFGGRGFGSANMPMMRGGFGSGMMRGYGWR